MWNAADPRGGMGQDAIRIQIKSVFFFFAVSVRACRWSKRIRIGVSGAIVRKGAIVNDDVSVIEQERESV